MRFTIKLAGRVIAVTALFPQTKHFCREYLSGEPAEISVTVLPQDIENERVIFERNNPKGDCSTQRFSDAYLETLALYRKIAEELIAFDTLLFHGSVIAVDGEAYLFTATSGTGKSTHTALWRAAFGARAQMVNDDKPLLKITESGVLVYGTPWDGKHRLSSNIAVPLKALCILKRDTVNHIEPISGREALPMLLQQSYRSGDPERLSACLKLADRLAKSVALYSLGCNMEPEAATVAFEGMNRARREDKTE